MNDTGVKNKMQLYLTMLIKESKFITNIPT